MALGDAPGFLDRALEPSVQTMSICAELNKSASLIKKKYALIYRAILRSRQRGCVVAIVSELASTDNSLPFYVNSVYVLVTQITAVLAEQHRF